MKPGYPGEGKVFFNLESKKPNMEQDYEKEELKEAFEESFEKVENLLVENVEVENSRLYRTVHSTLKDYGLVEGEPYNMDIGQDLAFKTTRKIYDRIPTTNHKGLGTNHYRTLKGRMVTKEVAEEVAWRENILRDARNYMEGFETEQMTEEEVKEEVTNYLVNETRLVEISGNDIWDVTSISSKLSFEFETRPEEPEVGGIKESEFEEVWEEF